MLQVFDTHRLSYKNAVLRAWGDSLKTIALDFYDNTSPVAGGAGASNVGPRVRTNEQGYLFNTDGTQPIHSLLLQDSAIIEVSLDGGTSWPIQWTVYDLVTDAVQSVLSGLKTLTYHTKNGTQVFNPRIANATLPEYAFKSDFAQGEWAEEEIYVDDNTSFAITKWTHYIQLVTGVTEVTITGSLRAGQYILFRAAVNCIVHFKDQTINMAAGHVYVLWAIKTFVDITNVTDAHITTLATAIAVSLIKTAMPDPIVYKFVQNQDNYQVNQVVTPSSWNTGGGEPTPNSSSIVCVFESTYGGDTITLHIKNPTKLGNHFITVLASRTDTSGSHNIYLKVGNNTRVLIGSWGAGTGTYNCSLNLVMYKSIGGQYYNAVHYLNNSVDNQAQV